MEGWASNAPLHVTERSPRILRVSSAFTWPAFGIPTRMPACCRTVGSDTVDSILPKSSGGPAYLSRSGKSVDAATVCVGNARGAPARTAPVRRRDRRAVSRHEARADAVVRLRSIDVGLDDGAARGLAGRNRRVNALDRGFLEVERRRRLWGAAGNGDRAHEQGGPGGRGHDSARRRVVHRGRFSQTAYRCAGQQADRPETCSVVFAQARVERPWGQYRSTAIPAGTRYDPFPLLHAPLSTEQHLAVRRKPGKGPRPSTGHHHILGNRGHLCGVDRCLRGVTYRGPLVRATISGLSCAMVKNTRARNRAKEPPNVIT